MTTTYDPFHPRYFDEGDLREEMTRVYDLCHGCRLCFKFCSAFPTLFESIDQHEDQDAARLTRAEQDQVVHECFNCKLCYVHCPYIPDQHEWALDFPRLMLRAEEVLHRTQKRSLKSRLTDQALGRTDLAGKVNTRVAGLVNRVVEKPGSLGRNLMEKTAGIASQRILSPYARQRFSTWWRKRQRDDFRREVIDLKRRRRVTVGDFVTLLFENEQTIRFQIHEMARAEKLISDEAIETELRIYNPLIPQPGQLCATLFVELTSKEALMEWLPKLVGIEQAIGLRLADGETVPPLVDEDHEKQLTREEITASVHYVRWELTDDQVERFAAGPVSLTISHPEYSYALELPAATHAELSGDLRNGG